MKRGLDCKSLCMNRLLEILTNFILSCLNPSMIRLQLFIVVADVLMHGCVLILRLWSKRRAPSFHRISQSLIRQVLWESIELRFSYVLDGVSSFSNTNYLPYLTIYLSFQAQLEPNAAMVAVKVCGIDRGNFMICRAAENNYLLITLFIDTCNEFQTNQFSYLRYLSCILDPHD